MGDAWGIDRWEKSRVPDKPPPEVGGLIIIAILLAILAVLLSK